MKSLKKKKTRVCCLLWRRRGGVALICTAPSNSLLLSFFRLLSHVSPTFYPPRHFSVISPFPAGATHLVAEGTWGEMEQAQGFSALPHASFEFVAVFLGSYRPRRSAAIPKSCSVLRNELFPSPFSFVKEHYQSNEIWELSKGSF
jgi:hypothetical protein